MKELLALGADSKAQTPDGTGAVLLVALMIRQVMIVYENVGLTRDLEGKVAARTAELTTLGTLAFLCTAIGAALFRFGARRVVPAETLLREVRGSFYRKLFLAFVAAVVIPVALLALVARSFVAAEMRTGVEREALRTSAAASRVVADLIAPQAAQQGSSLDDNLMVWVSRLIDEDANIFAGTTLQATSERTVFASGLLPTRTPAESVCA